MAKKPTPTLRKPPSPDAFVFGKQQVSKVTSQQADKSGEYARATYYVRPEQARDLKLRAVAEGRNLSEIVRDAFDAYLGKGR